jgi:Fe-S-cluster containining protein
MTPQDGLRFHCVPGCTNCCRAQGYVYITPADLERMAAYVNLTPAEFESRYVYRTRRLMRLRKPRTSQCHFLNDTGCTIHPSKPAQCRLFPFWPELVEDREAWNQASGNCPGIGRGRLIQIGSAVEKANEMRIAYPELYKG